MVFNISNGTYSASLSERSPRPTRPRRVGSLHRGLSADNSAYLEFCSTYDNPSFQYDDFSHGPPTSKYKYADEEPTSITFNEGGEKRTCCCYAVFILLIILIYAGVIVGVCVYFLVVLPEQTALMKPIEHYTNIFSCQARVVRGPFSTYNMMLNSPMSSEHLTFAAAWRFKMDQNFKSSSLADSYDSTTVTGFAEGSVIVNFDIRLTKEIGAGEMAYENIKSIILSSCNKKEGTSNECVSGVFVFSRDDINVTSTGKKTEYPITTTPITPGPECVKIPNDTFFGCHNFYTHAQFPNYLNLTTMKSAKASLQSNEVLVSTKCYRHAKLFVCSILLPKCVTKTVNITTTAQPIDAATTQNLGNGTATTQAAGGATETTTPQTGTTLAATSQTATTKPVKTGTTQQAAVATTAGSGTTGTVAGGGTTTQTSGGTASTQPPAAATTSAGTTGGTIQKRSENAAGTTEMQYPQSVEQPIRLPPCRNICLAAMTNCRWLYSWGSSTQYLALNCSDFPDSTDPNICVGGKEEATPSTPTPCSKDYFHCDNPKRCVRDTWKCDGFNDCKDGKDEAGCSSCPAAKYQCTGGACVDKTARCNGVGECSMDSDERQCVKLSSTSVTTVNGAGELQVFSSAKDSFVPVCATDWNSNATDLVCKQMRYSSENASYDEVNATGTEAATLNSTDLSDEYVQANLDTGATCPEKKTVKIECGLAECGVRPAYIPSFARIVGGTEVRPGTWPWAVGLYGGASGAYYCQGALINEQWVMTAAHCIGGMTPSDGVKAYMGTTRRLAYSKYKQVRSAVKMVKHPNHTMPHPPNDIGLIKLDSPVVFTDYVRPICLPPIGKKMKAGMTGYVAGWGLTIEGGKSYSDVQKQVLVTLTDTVQCSATLINVHTYFKGMIQKGKSICAIGKKGYDSCQGDSGGPLVFEEKGVWFAGGVVATGVGCARAIPAVYTNVPYYADWIHSVIGS